MKILITGANRGLGLVATESFQKEGWEVYPWTRKNLDYLNMKGWDSVVPKVDVVLHCAGGGLGMRGPYLTAQALHDLWMVNVGGALEINRIIGPQMQADGKGTIIHVCSIASGEAIGSVGYNTVKAALAAYIRSLGRVLAPFGVVVTGIAPGGFQAPGNAMDKLERDNPEAYREFTEKRLPRGYMGDANELMPLLKYLASPAASMMGGCLVPIDAGEGHYYSTS